MLAGKSRIVYPLDGKHLGGIGGQQATLTGQLRAGLGTVCGNDIDGGAAVEGMTVYLPCMGFAWLLLVTVRRRRSQ